MLRCGFLASEVSEKVNASLPLHTNPLNGPDWFFYFEGRLSETGRAACFCLCWQRCKVRPSVLLWWRKNESLLTLRLFWFASCFTLASRLAYWSPAMSAMWRRLQVKVGPARGLLTSTQVIRRSTWLNGQLSLCQSFSTGTSLRNDFFKGGSNQETTVMQLSKPAYI